jgi:hypothetical protein
MGYDLGATMKRGGHNSRSVFGEEGGDVLPPSLSLSATMGSSTVRGGARYGTGNSSSSALVSSSSGTQTVGNASATLRTSGGSQNRCEMYFAFICIVITCSLFIHRNSGELKKLAEESLRNLQETRSLNRSEAAEETQQGQVRQLARDRATAATTSSSTTTTTTTRTTSQQKRGQNQTTTSSTGRGGLSRSAMDDLELTVDSDSALWAFEASGGEF